MARLFSEEYHEISNTWYFKDTIVDLHKGELLYHVTKNEKGDILFRFYAVPTKKRYFPGDLYISYDATKERITGTSCNSCLILNPENSKKKAVKDTDRYCRHYLSVINYCYHFLSTEIIDTVNTAIYTNNLLSYDEYRQSESVNGKVVIEGIYDRQLDKIRFHFSGYEDIELYLISLLAADKPITAKNAAKKDLAAEQKVALTDAEISLLGTLQHIKCAHSAAKKCWTIYKSNFVKTFPFLNTLTQAGKVTVKETGEKLIFSEEKFQLSLRVTKSRRGDPELAEDVAAREDTRSAGQDSPAYVIKPSSSCFYSVCFVNNLTYILVENTVYTLRLPFPKKVIEQIFSGGYCCTEQDMIYLATTVAKQLAMVGYYLDFDEDIVLPEHYAAKPQVVFNLSSESDTRDLSSEKEGCNESGCVKMSCVFDYHGKLLPFSGLTIRSNLVAIEIDGRLVWFHIPYTVHEEVNNFMKLLPVPDIDKLNDDGYLLYFTEHKIDSLKQLFYEKANPEWTIDLDEKLKKEFIYKVELKPLIKIEKSEEIDWFDYNVEYKVQDITFSHHELKEFFSKHRKYLKLPDGKLVYFSNKDTYDKIDKQLFHFKNRAEKGDRVSHYNLSYLYTLSRNDERIKLIGDKYLDTMFADLLRRRPEKKCEVPLALYNVMRGYQKTGFRWLKMLQEYRLGGILADDMGLGKTLQTLAILADYYDVHNPEKHPEAEKGDSHIKLLPSLVVCPKTLLFNWAAEIEKFHSNLSYSIYEGSKNERKGFFEDNNSEVVIASYALVSSDVEAFLEQRFGYVVLDEAQHIKNPQALRSKAVKRLKSNHRLALTGTPLENNIQELWSIYDFLMPGYLQSLRKFKKTYSPVSLDNKQDNEQQEAPQDDKPQIKPIPLQEMISPFMLRRIKSDVLLELPDKQEQILYCKMSPQQEKLYLKIIAMAKSEILPQVDFSQKAVITPRIYINVLAALTRMRQVCNHPGLIKKSLEDKQGVSGKLELLTEITSEALDNRRNILVFSQFSTMLKKIAHKLDDMGVVYEYMDGATRNREQRINNFSTNDNVRVFLLTLKVGGLGLNLTKADTVILVDPWWNPMAENQSIDRAHRIGQTKKVMVYKLITKGSVEEKILQLQSVKLNLFNNIIENSQSVIKNISADDIRKLFEYDGGLDGKR